MLEERRRCATIGDASSFVTKTREDSRGFSKLLRHLVADMARARLCNAAASLTSTSTKTTSHLGTCVVDIVSHDFIYDSSTLSQVSQVHPHFL
jgi:hypothetical protein